jgi:hypothetical protein
MKKLILAAILAALAPYSAVAQTSWTFKDAAGATQTAKSFNCSAIICSVAVPTDSTGAAFGVTANPFFTTTQGWAGGTLGAMANFGTSPGAVLSLG